MVVVLAAVLVADSAVAQVVAYVAVSVVALVVE